MTDASGTSATWVAANLWLTPRKAPLVVVLAGIDSSHIVEAALADTALMEAAMVRFEPNCAPPCDALLWRLEVASGESLNQPGLLRHRWHRPPYALTLRLVQYQPGSMVPTILDEGTLGTRGSYAAFKIAADRWAMRFLRDAALGRARGPSDAQPAAVPHGLPGWLDAIRGTWRKRRMTKRWSVGTAAGPLERVLTGDGLGDNTWHRADAGACVPSAPCPPPPGGRTLRQETPLNGALSPNESVANSTGRVAPSIVLRDDGKSHAYPSTLSDADTIYCVPHAPLRGATRIHRLDEHGKFVPICDAAPNLRLSNPTLFRWNNRYWLACTDLDAGACDNLCLLHAPAVTGPWTPHTRWPVKMDVRGARPAGMLFDVAGRLFRPGQDCAATPGSAIAIHEILTLTETEFREILVSVLQPDRSGAFPLGFHTLSYDGKRFRLEATPRLPEPSQFYRKMLGKIGSAGSRAGAA